MHKNTFFLVTFLAVIAALLVGFNVGKKFTGATEEPNLPVAAVTPSMPPIQTSIYKDIYCGISLSYPSGMTVTESASGSARFASTNETVMLGCQKDIPGIAIPDNKKETVKIGSISGVLYHTATPKDGTPIDVFIFRHPTNGMDVLLSGMGSLFTSVMESLTLIQ